LTFQIEKEKVVFSVMKRRLLFLFMALLISSCSGQSFITPTATSLPSLTPTIISTSLPTSTQTPNPTEDPLSDYILPQIPAGFTWKMAPDLETIFLMPDGWFFNREYCPVISFYETTFLSLDEIGQACISKENPLEVGKYSTGQAVVVYSHIENPEEFAKYILHVLATSPNFGLLFAGAQEDTKDFLIKFPVEIYMRDVHQTKTVIDSWDYKTDQYVAHHLRVKAEYAKETGNNRNKVVQYTAVASKDKVHLMIFEVPSDKWDETMKKYSLLLDYFIVLSNQGVP
jgi:hypothetical protein